MTQIKKKDMLMYYHTAIRNVGLYTSVSIAMLGYSRFYRGKIKLYNIAFIIISLVFLLFSMLLNYHIIITINDMKLGIADDDIDVSIEHLTRLPYIVIITNIFVVGSPICLALNKLQVILSENYMAFIISCGVGFGMFIKGIID